jgi:hypothetical protein
MLAATCAETACPLETLPVHNDLWYALPLIVSISFVYAGTRHESLELIWQHAIRVALWITIFMGAVMLLLAALDRWLL